MDPIFNPTPEAIEDVLELIKSGTSARGYISIFLTDGKRLREEAIMMQIVRKVRPPWLHNPSQSNSVFLAHQYSCSMVFVHDRTTHLVMDAISGDTLEATAFKMQSTALQKTAEQLPAVDQLQSLTSEFPLSW